MTLAGVGSWQEELQGGEKTGRGGGAGGFSGGRALPHITQIIMADAGLGTHHTAESNLERTLSGRGCLQI